MEECLGCMHGLAADREGEVEVLVIGGRYGKEE